jgi:hypothetical protein
MIQKIISNALLAARIWSPAAAVLRAYQRRSHNKSRDPQCDAANRGESQSSPQIIR